MSLPCMVRVDAHPKPPPFTPHISLPRDFCAYGDAVAGCDQVPASNEHRRLCACGCASQGAGSGCATDGTACATKVGSTTMLACQEPAAGFWLDGGVATGISLSIGRCLFRAQATYPHQRAPNRSVRCASRLLPVHVRRVLGLGRYHGQAPLRGSRYGVHTSRRCRQRSVPPSYSV